MNKIQEIFLSGKLPDKMSSVQVKAVSSIQKCRTSKLGGFKTICEDCGAETYRYCSCGNRSCPQCQGLKQKQWVTARMSESLNVAYYHVVFTVPNDLNTTMLQKSAAMYNILFRAASDTLLTVCSDSKWLGAKPGIIAVLHTWGSTLSYHPHLHVILSSCGLNHFNKVVFPKSEKFFIPVRVLSKVFRGKFLDYMKTANISFDDALYQKDWVVHLKDTCDYGQNVVEYLGRYTHRAAITESRIVSFSEKHVTFTYKDYRDDCKIKEMNLTTEEFIRRFLMHVLPKGFRKVRFYGFLCNRNKKMLLTILRNELKSPTRENILEGLSLKEVCRVLFGKDFGVCQDCGSIHLKRVTLSPRPYPRE